MNLEMTEHQADFLSSKQRFCLLSGGIGSGKTWIGSIYVMLKASVDSDTLGLIGANTYKQLHNSTLACLFSELDNVGLNFKYNQNKGILNIENKMRIICTSMENYQTLRGLELGWFWIDECRDMKEEAFMVLMGRLRDKKAKRLEGRLTSSPAGFNWLYDYFAGDRKTAEFELIQASSIDNPFLPYGYIESLKTSYDSKIYAQEVGGEFINITQGQVYYAFNRSNNVTKLQLAKQKDIKGNEVNLPIWIAVDFNVSPITASICQVYDETIHVIDEFYIMDSNTDELAKEIKLKYGTGHKIVPDSTGKRKQTSSAGLSDFQILKDHGFHVMNVRNPHRQDRYNCVNSLLEKRRILIDPQCKKLIKDLERVTFKQGSNQVDDSDHLLTHCSDNLGYLAHYLFPIIKKPKYSLRQR